MVWCDFQWSWVTFNLDFKVTEMPIPLDVLCAQLMRNLINIIESRSNIFYFIVDVDNSDILRRNSEPEVISTKATDIAETSTIIEKVWSRFNYINNVWESTDTTYMVQESAEKILSLMKCNYNLFNTAANNTITNEHC